MDHVTYKIHCSRDYSWDKIAVTIAKRNLLTRELQILKPLEFEKSDPTQIMGPPSLMLTNDEAQELMENLWASGIRPNEDIGSTGQVSALKYHLEDMRKLVFNDKPSIGPIR